eukprot:TRINITY_DN6026_c0_g1_i2.p1 TRINITY_DN6026_c0_g1~~TRINITY_DN6026_c0_g1_i2.p1  ORF type:complete len:252 (+),score=37.56 TRINITY_DN6026_c0_g1_i2:105-860(+)
MSLHNPLATTDDCIAWSQMILKERKIDGGIRDDQAPASVHLTTWRVKPKSTVRPEQLRAPWVKSITQAPRTSLSKESWEDLCGNLVSMMRPSTHGGDQRCLTLQRSETAPGVLPSRLDRDAHASAQSEGRSAASSCSISESRSPSSSRPLSRPQPPSRGQGSTTSSFKEPLFAAGSLTMESIGSRSQTWSPEEASDGIQSGGGSPWYVAGSRGAREGPPSRSGARTPAPIGSWRSTRVPGRSRSATRTLTF